MTDTEKIINILKNKLVKIDGIKAVYLYGSILRSDFNKKSDIDVLILAKERKNPTVWENKIKKALKNIAKIDTTIIFDSEYKDGLHPGWSNYFFLNVKRNSKLIIGKDVIKQFNDYKINFDEAYKRIVWLCQRAREVVVSKTKSKEYNFWEIKLRRWIPICVAELLYLSGIYEPIPSKSMEKFFKLYKGFKEIDIKSANLKCMHNFLEELRIVCLKMRRNIKVREGVAVILYKKFGRTKRFLLLERKEKMKGWEFVKGGIEKNETVKQAAFREVKEESGLNNLKFIKVLPHKFSIRMIHKNNLEERIYTVVLMETEDKKFKVDKKLFQKTKFFKKSEALKRMIWPEYKEALTIASKHLTD
jgi:8-oxo-dGTP pyrophosphatase MutT (NUDIX family)/predicted nucleotidyltransferase